MADSIRFILNGEDIALSSLDPTETLLDFLRLKRRLTGSKEGCAEGGLWCLHGAGRTYGLGPARV